MVRKWGSMAWCYRSVKVREEGVTVIDTEVRAEAQILPGQEQEENKAAERRLDTSL